MLFSPPHNASWVETLPEGHQGTWRTLETMAYLVRKDINSPRVCVMVDDLLAGRTGSDAISALFFFARDQITFIEDPPGLEKVSDFQRTIEAGYGDCDDKSVWLATALCSINIPTRFVVQSHDGQDWNHVYCEFFDWWQWKWIALDPTADGHTGVIAEIGWSQPLPPWGYEMRYSI